MNVQPAEYVVSFKLRTLHPDDYVRLEEIVHDGSFRRQKILPLFHHQQVGYFKVHSRQSGLTHWGLCDLPGEPQIRVVLNNNKR